jgi:hypothetical protein
VRSRDYKSPSANSSFVTFASVPSRGSGRVCVEVKAIAPFPVRQFHAAPNLTANIFLRPRFLRFLPKSPTSSRWPNAGDASLQRSLMVSFLTWASWHSNETRKLPAERLRICFHYAEHIGSPATTLPTLIWPSADVCRSLLSMTICVRPPGNWASAFYDRSRRVLVLPG